MAKTGTRNWSKDQKVKGVKTVHVHLLIDRSGSMATLRSDVIGGFNAFVADQQAQEGLARLSLHQFDSGGFDTLFESMDIKRVREADDSDFLPRGTTPLFDAIGHTITRAQARADTPTGKGEQPIIVIFTDGYENASHEYTAEAIRTLIKAKEAQGWVFTYLGANQDAFLVAKGIGISSYATQNYIPDTTGVITSFRSVSGGVTNARGMATTGETVTSEAFYSNTGTAANDDWEARNSGSSSTPSTPRSWDKEE